MANVLHFCLPQFVNGRRNNKIWYHWIRAHWGSTCAYDSNQSRCRTRCCCRYKNVEDLAMQNFQVPLYESVEEMLMPHSNIQVVCIATPNGYHCQHAIQALSMGCHVVVEKPMALSVDDCDAIIQEAQKRNKRIFCVMQNRFSPPSQWIKSIIDDKILGEIFSSASGLLLEPGPSLLQKGTLARNGGFRRRCAIYSVFTFHRYGLLAVRATCY